MKRIFKISFLLSGIIFMQINHTFLHSSCTAKKLK